MISIDNDGIEQALNLLRNNEVVGMPTETVYGLAGSINSEIALRKIFSKKERPFFDPLIVHVAHVDQAKSLALNWEHAHDVLAHAFWPGPLTLVVEKKSEVSKLITSGLLTVGIRMPNHPMALKLINDFGSPLAAPSANKFGKTSPTSANHVREEFLQDDVFVLDGGECVVGLESTVLYLSLDPKTSMVSLAILRSGHILLSDIVKVLEKAAFKINLETSNLNVSAPGQMKHHYMPKKPLVFLDEGVDIESSIQNIQNLISRMPETVESVRIARPKTIASWRELTLSEKPEEAARELYSKLREVSVGNEDIIYFKKKAFHRGEHWEAVLDRLGKASTLKI